jgi:hypothetical protein
MIIDNDKDTLYMSESMLIEFQKQDKQQQKYTIDSFVSSIGAKKQFLDTNYTGNYSTAYLVIIDIIILVLMDYNYTKYLEPWI